MKVSIENLTFNCIIGILPFEREKEQRVIIDCSFEYDFQNNIFIDYSEIANFIEISMKNEKFLLIEDAILFLNEKITKDNKINKLQLTISKPDILDNCIVSVSL